MLENDIQRAALEMINLFDLDAAWYAEFRANDLLEQGEARRAEAWQQIGKAIEARQPTPA